MTHPRLEELDPTTFRRLEEILDRALELPPGELAAFLDRACGADAAMRARIDALLAADASEGGPLDQPFASIAARLIEKEDEEEAGRFEGRRFGPWRAVREIGHGGMGAVWLAERADGSFEQRVAIKIVPAALVSRNMRVRFEQERRILARIEHPNIARLLDGGVTEEGLPWLAMEFVAGEPITAWCERRRADLDLRLRLFMDAARAVAAAHRQLVIHRDLKPANILVTGEGRLKLLDFGIARLIEPGDDADETHTLDRRLTPRYAAPEQVRGENPTTATDIWALGLLLYRLLSGVHPFAAEGTDLRALENAVLRREPAPPSAVLAATPPAARPGIEPAALRGDLDHIVLQAMRKEPERRYASAEAMIEDIERFRDRRPVRAMPPSATYRMAKFVRRNRAGVIAGGLALIALVVGLVAALWQAETARHERDRATRILDFLVATLANAGPRRLSSGFVAVGDPDPNRPIRAVLAGAAARAEREFADDPVALGSVATTLGEAMLALRLDPAADSVLAVAADAYARSGLEEKRLEPLSLRALALANLGHAEQAESLAATVVAFHRRRHPGGIELASALITQATIQDRQRNPDSESSISEALALLDGHVPPDHPTLIEALNARAVHLMARGRDAQAESLYRSLLPRSEHSLGADHPRTLTIRANLATAIFNQARWAQAESLFRQVLDDRRRVLGPEHPDVATMINSIAFAAREQGRLEEADSLYRQAIDMRTRLLGPDARETLVSESGLANLLRMQGHPRESEVMVRRVLAIRRRTLPPNDPLIASSLSSLGEALADQGRWEEAEIQLREALAVREAAEPVNPRDVGKARAALDSLHARRLAQRAGPAPRSSGGRSSRRGFD